MSKFANIFEQVQEEQRTQEAAARPPERRQRKPVATLAIPPVPAPQTSRAAEPRRRGRPTGKHSDPDYVQTTAYIRRSTRRDVKKVLLDQEREYSELIEELLLGWLKKQG